MQARTLLYVMLCSILGGCGGSPMSMPDDTDDPMSNGSMMDAPPVGNENDGGSNAGAVASGLKLDNPTPEFEDLFGDQVATDGQTVIVGTEFDNTLEGSVAIFSRSGDMWPFQVELTGGPSTVPQQGFGSAVAVNGRYAFIGAYKYAVPGTLGIQRGGVYVYEGSGATWASSQLLTIPDGLDFEQFGNSLAFDPESERLVVGAVGRDRSQGAAYVFSRDGDLWVQEARLVASDGINFEDFGVDVAVAGDTVVVGASNQDFGTGAVYVYHRNGMWQEAQKILAPDGTRGDKFGDNVRIDGDTLVISAPAKGRPGDTLLRAGYVYTYIRENDAWVYDQTLIPFDDDAGVFGTAIALQDGVLVVAAPSISEALLLEQRNGNWTEVARIGSKNEVFVIDSFSESMSIAGDTLVVGARSAVSGGVGTAGAAYIFDLDALR